jgi:two-component system response regulator YesN
MHKVLIIDDEPTMREGLEFLIDWEAYGFKIIDSAENGKLGLEKIIAYKPDLVITDIRMPRMDGLEMIKEVQSMETSPQFIVLSGYSDFKYAKEAVSLGVFSYLLKPIDENELIKELSKIKEDIELYKEQQESLLQYKAYEISSRIKAYLINQQYSNELKKILQHRSFRLIGCIYNSATINRRQLEKLIPDSERLQTYTFNHGNTLYILVLGSDEKTCEQYLNLLNSTIQPEEKSIVMTISESVDSLEQLPKIYGQIQLLKEKIYVFDDEMILTSELLNVTSNNPNMFDEIQLLKKSLTEVIKGNNLEKFPKIKSHFIEIYKKSGWEIEIIKANLSEVMIFCLESLAKRMDDSELQKYRSDILSVILSKETLRDALSELENIFQNIALTYQQSFESENIVQKIIRYTKENYEKELTMTDIAEKFNYSHSYLGKKFRTETGMSYHIYLDQIRIEEAKSLLSDSSLYIYEISERVGYSSSDYFHKKFKENIGLSPNQYRNKVTEDIY